MKRTKLLIVIILLFSIQVFPQNKTFRLHSGWKAKKASEVTVDGTVISGKDFKLYDWIDAVVPGTVLTTLLHNHKIPDPFFGMNNTLIPDISEAGPSHYTYWFLNEFETEPLKEGDQVWLKFRGINYSADIYLNGERVNTDTHEGMYLREKYLITPYLQDGKNRLAILVSPPDPAGSPDGQGGDGLIGRSVTMQFTAGWDWICPIADRNTGIWDEVSLEITGPVDLVDPFVRTKVPGKRLPQGKQAPALITASTDLVNSTENEVKGKLTARTGKYEVSKAVVIPAGEKITVQLPEIKVEDPELWWPNGVGDHPLYDMELSFIPDHGMISDQEQVSYGIREVTTRFDEKPGARIFSVNGQDIFIKGGNWIASDAMLRLSTERYEAEVRMHAEMNMNMIRVWGGSMTERPEFYDACDKYGLLVWQDLWISGDCNGRWYDPKKKDSQARRRAYPDKHSLFLKTAADQIKMLRNHPSLFIWCGGNEFPPPPDIDKELRTKIFPLYDPTRYYLNESTSPDLARNTIGGGGDGPYGIQNPLHFFTKPSYPFNPELGSVGMPNVETMRKIMKEEDLVIPSGRRVHPTWEYHKYIGYENFIDQYGAPKDIDNFCRKAQLVNYEQYRALQEGFNSRMWTAYSGMLVWKNQNPWTALRGQFYDVFLEQNGGFYGYRHGATPLHVQLNLNDSTVCLVNQTVQNFPDLTVSAEIFDIHGKSLWKEQFRASTEANRITVLKPIHTAAIKDDVCFLRLKLSDKNGKLIDENFYWLSGTGKSYDGLNELKEVEPVLKLVKNSSGIKTVQISNPSNETAFFIRLKVSGQDSKELALPVFFSENYFTLLPGESRQITIDLSLLQEKAESESLQIETEGWNIKKGSLSVNL
ncbi:MAG: glycoside hydrolase family 2 protein [Mangrovibacterium sp.]